MTVEAAREYHRQQLSVLVDANIDLLVAYTQTNVNEAVGTALAAKDLAAPILISATVETDGRLPDGTGLGEFLRQVDSLTGGPYRFSRNPMYLAVAVVHIGLAVAVGSGWAIGSVAVAVALVHNLAILPEERYLEKKFGDEYTKLKGSVRRWV